MFPIPVGTRVVKHWSNPGDPHKNGTMGTVTKVIPIDPMDRIDLSNPDQHCYLVKFDGDKDETFIIDRNILPLHLMKRLFKKSLPKLKKKMFGAVAQSDRATDF